MANTQAQEVYNAFEATFSDKKEIPESLELQWLKMSVGRYNAEIAIDEPLNFDEELLEFDKQIDQYTISTLGQMIRELYQEREFSRVTKIASIVGGDLSVNGTNGLQKYSKEELDYHTSKTNDMIENQKPTALS